MVNTIVAEVDQIEDVLYAKMQRLLTKNLKLLFNLRFNDKKTQKKLRYSSNDSSEIAQDIPPVRRRRRGKN